MGGGAARARSSNTAHARPSSKARASPWRPVVTSALGWAHYVRANLDEAVRRLKETTEIAPPVEQWIVGVAAIADLSLIAGMRGRRAEQMRLAEEAVALTREVGLIDAVEDGEVHTAYGVALAAAGRREEAIAHLEKGVFLRRLWAQPLDLVDGLIALATRTRSAAGRPDLVVTATPCRHGPPLSHPLVGDVIGFAIGGLWITGDTVLYDGVGQAAAKLDVDIVLLHLGGVRFPVTGPLRYTMNAREGLGLVRLLKPRVTIPIHYEGWRHFREGRAAIEREFGAAGEPLTWLPVGEPTGVRG